MRVIDIENIVTNMKDDARFVLRCEEVFHDKISAAAASILMNKSKKTARLPDRPERQRQDHHRHAPEGVSGKPRREGVPAEHG